MKKLIKSLLVASLLSSGSLFAYSALDGVKAQKADALQYVKKFITASELTKWMKDGKKFEILDVREADEWNAGKISYSHTIKLQRGKLYSGVKKGVLKPKKTYVLVCRTGHRAILGAAVLNKYYKFENIYVLKGGVKAWINNGGDIDNQLHLGKVKIKLKK